MEEDADNIKMTVIELISDLKENIFTKDEERKDLVMVEFFFNKLSASSIASHIIKHVLPFESKIVVRDIKFFLEKKNEILSGMPQNRIDYFSTLIQKSEKEGGMSSENRNVIWAYFDTLIGLAKKYKKLK
jgi:hypothetical protein